MFDTSNYSKYENLLRYSSFLEFLEIEDDLFLVKSISSTEEKKIALITGFSINELYSSKNSNYIKDYSKALHYLSLYISHSVIFLNNENFLINREKNIVDLSESLALLPIFFLEKIVAHLMNLKDKEMAFLRDLDNFSKTTFSKLFFDLLKSGYKFNSFEITGIEGFHNIPVCLLQQMFLSKMYLNERIEKEDFLKFIGRYIGSFFNSKAAKDLENKENIFKAREIINSRGIEDLNKNALLTKDSLYQDMKNLMEGNLDGHDAILRGQELEDYNHWVSEKREKIAAYNNSSKKLKVNSFIQEPTEYELRKEFVEANKYCGWLLDEYIKKGHKSWEIFTQSKDFSGLDDYSILEEFLIYNPEHSWLRIEFGRKSFKLFLRKSRYNNDRRSEEDLLNEFVKIDNRYNWLIEDYQKDKSWMKE